MPIIQYVLPSKNKQLKKLLHFYWEVCPKYDENGKLKQEMILVVCVFNNHSSLCYIILTCLCSNAIRNDLVSSVITPQSSLCSRSPPSNIQTNISAAQPSVSFKKYLKTLNCSNRSSQPPLLRPQKRRLRCIYYREFENLIPDAPELM